MKPLIFLGTGIGNLEFPISICNLLGIPVAGIIDSDYFGNTKDMSGIPVIGSEENFDFDTASKTYDFFVGASGYIRDLRSFKKRMRYVELVEQKQLPCATLIHPTSEILKSGTVIEPGCLIGFCAGIDYNVRIGKHSQLHSFSVVAHDVVIGQNCSLGTHSFYMPYINIGNHVTVGPGAAIVRSNKGTTTIGDMAEIHPRVTVARDVEPGELVSLAGGNTRRIYGEVIRT